MEKMILKFLPLLFLIFFLTSYEVALLAPYQFYRKAMNEGVRGDFLELKKLPEFLYEGGSYKVEKMAGVSREEKRLWRMLHFGDFLVPFPVKHPQFIVVPVIEREAGRWLFGYKVLDYKKRELNSVLLKAPREFTLDLYKYKIFQLPLFKNRITQEGLSGPWRDLFSKSYSGEKYGKPSWGSLWNPFSIPIASMVYDLFIMKSRERFFSLKTKGIFYWKERKLGITDIVDDETAKMRPKSYRQEEVFFLKNRQVFKIILRTKLEDFAAEKYRQKFLKSFEFKQGHPDSSISLYGDYKLLSYKEKLGPTGLIFLYAALSHQKGSRQFIREMIQFLERGRNDRVYLDPLYRYAHDRFGSSFSKDMRKLKESQSEKLIRKREEEQEKLQEELRRKDDFVEQGEDFRSKEEKIKFYLQRAKDQKEDGDDHSRSLILN